MRKIVLLQMFAFSLFISHGQITKGSILVGSQFFYYGQNNQVEGYSKQRVQSASIGVSIGKAIKENSIVGFKLMYAPLKETNFIDGSDTVTNRVKWYNIGAFLREYKKIGKDFYFFF